MFHRWPPVLGRGGHLFFNHGGFGQLNPTLASGQRAGILHPNEVVAVAQHVVVGGCHVGGGECLSLKRALEVLAVILHVVGVTAAHDDADGLLLVVVVIDEVRHLGIHHVQGGGQDHLAVGHVCHRVERHACYGVLYLALVGIHASHVALGGDDDGDALQGHVGLCGDDGIVQRLVILVRKL